MRKEANALSMLESIKQKIAGNRRVDEQRTAEISAMRERLVDIENQLDTAVKECNVDLAAKLVAEKNEINMKLPVLDRIAEISTKPDLYYDDLLKVNAEYIKEFQPDVDKATSEIKKVYKVYAENVLELIKILDKAAAFRLKCAELCNVTAYYRSPKWLKFDNFEYDMDTYYAANNPDDRLLAKLKEMNPEVEEMIQHIKFYG